jgi:hypothetical protein
MSYEVYIDVRHHPRHLEDYERRLSDAGKYTEPDGADPTDAERMRTVVGALRGMAAQYDPDVRCTHCGALRHEHHGYPARLVNCFNRYGPTTQYSWWADSNCAANGGA